LRELATRGLRNPLRIRPGVSIAEDAAAPSRAELRKQLSIPDDHGPVILIGGDPIPGARQNHAAWVVGIISQLYRNTRCILRLDDTHHGNYLRDFAQTMAPGGRDNNFEPPIFVEPDEFSWQSLARASDIFLLTPDAPIPVYSLMAAMAASLPVIATATSEVSELVEHGRSALLAPPGNIKQITARVEEFMSDSRLRWPLTDAARTDIFAHFKPRYMTQCFAALYAQSLADPKLKNPIELPAPELTAADRFAGVVATN
jgi:glycosyltransferase involved in cell wall biosynthesis